MQLKTIEIQNFRSIRSVSIDVKHKCMIFVGKNEAGKSNILKAIAGCIDDSSYKIGAKDKRKRLAQEAAKEEILECVFELDDIDKEKAFSSLPCEVFDGALSVSGKPLSKREMIDLWFSKGLIEFSVATNTRTFKYFSLQPEYIVEISIVRMLKDYVEFDGVAFQKGDFVQEESLRKLEVGNEYYKSVCTEIVFT